ncbi:MAG: response regulator transcription factor, partial [Terriglobales bacterium]
MAKILVVDDDKDLCGAVEDCLQFNHHLVELAHTGGDALERLRISNYDAVILDWDLPEID